MEKARVSVTQFESEGDSDCAPWPDAAEPPAAALSADAEPDAETPGAETPGAETPGAETPNAETPGAETPNAETPGAETETAYPAPELLIVPDPPAPDWIFVLVGGDGYAGAFTSAEAAAAAAALFPNTPLVAMRAPYAPAPTRQDCVHDRWVWVVPQPGSSVPVAVSNCRGRAAAAAAAFAAIGAGYGENVNYWRAPLGDLAPAAMKRLAAQERAIAQAVEGYERPTRAEPGIDGCAEPDESLDDPPPAEFAMNIVDAIVAVEAAAGCGCAAAEDDAEVSEIAEVGGELSESGSGDLSD